MTDGLAYPWHADTWRRVQQARRAGRLPHALLLAGPAGLGKSAFAARLSDALVCGQPDPQGDACGSCAACRASRGGAHPDLHRVTPDEPGKPIRIDAIRALSGKSVLAAQDGGYRVFLLAPAEAMNRAAANALLKTLEEPTPRSVLILVSSHPDRLPATIRSRCQRVKFSAPPPGEVEAWLKQRVAPAAVADLLAISGGMPLRALQAGEEGWLEEGRRLVGELTALRQRQINPLQTVEEWEKRPLTTILDGLKRCVADLVRLAYGLKDTRIYHPSLCAELQCVGQDLDLRQLHRLHDDLLRLDRDQSHNPNKQMLLEHIANRWLQITRPGGR
jgi:DNA polymerase-3 subunit delta'